LGWCLFLWFVDADVSLFSIKSKRNQGMDKHLTTKDLIKRWKTKESTLSYWRWAGKGPRFIKTGRSILYPIEEIQAFEAKLKESTAQITPWAKPQWL
jgi:hypothetical protein